MSWVKNLQIHFTRSYTSACQYNSLAISEYFSFLYVWLWMEVLQKKFIEVITVQSQCVFPYSLSTFKLYWIPKIFPCIIHICIAKLVNMKLYPAAFGISSPVPECFLHIKLNYLLKWGKTQRLSVYHWELLIF